MVFMAGSSYLSVIQMYQVERFVPRKAHFVLSGADGNDSVSRGFFIKDDGAH